MTRWQSYHPGRPLLPCNGKMYGVHIYALISFSMCASLCAARDVHAQKELYTPDYNVYHNLSTIQNHLMKIVEKNKNYMKLIKDYKSRENIPQPLLHITNFEGSHTVNVNSVPVPKVQLLLSYGEHAREFLPVESLFHFLHNLTDCLHSPTSSPEYAYAWKLLTDVDLYIICVANPDGRRHVENTKNYCWRGTSTGVDLNRNFDWEFALKGSSNDPLDEEFRGQNAFSEPECEVFREVSSKYQLDAFISFHSGIRQIYVPFADSHSKKSGRRPDNVGSMLTLASNLSHATKFSYKYGVAVELNEYTADGTIFDYMAGVRKIPFSLAVEMWGSGFNHRGESCFDLFNPRSEDLQMTVEALQPMYDSLFSYLIRWKRQHYLQDVFSVHSQQETPSLTFGYILLAVVVILTIVMGIHSWCPICPRMLHFRRRIVRLRSLSSTWSISAMKP